MVLGLFISIQNLSSIVILSANDLKPCAFISFKYIISPTVFYNIVSYNSYLNKEKTANTVYFSLK